jgi:hypothetical protein
VVRWMCRKGPVGLLEMLQTSLVVKTGGIIYMSASSTHVCVWGGRVCARRRVDIGVCLPALTGVFGVCVGG